MYVSRCVICPFSVLLGYFSPIVMYFWYQFNEYAFEYLYFVLCVCFSKNRYTNLIIILSLFTSSLFVGCKCYEYSRLCFYSSSCVCFRFHYGFHLPTFCYVREYLDFWFPFFINLFFIFVEDLTWPYRPIHISDIGKFS